VCDKGVSEISSGIGSQALGADVTGLGQGEGIGSRAGWGLSEKTGVCHCLSAFYWLTLGQGQPIRLYLLCRRDKPWIHVSDACEHSQKVCVCVCLLV
jgi:hypothetical protein